MIVYAAPTQYRTLWTPRRAGPASSLRSSLGLADLMTWLSLSLSLSPSLSLSLFYPGGQGAATPDSGPRRALYAGAPRHWDGLKPPEQPRSPRQGGNGTDREARGGGPRPPDLAPAERSPGGRSPTGARDREVHAPQDVGRSQVSPSETCQEGECGGGPKDVRSMLGLRPVAGAPVSPGGSPPMVGTQGGPARPKAKHAPRKPAHQRARKPKRLPEPSGDPRGHIQRWLVPGAAAGHTDQEGCPTSVEGPTRHAPARHGPQTDCSTEPWPGPGTIPAVLGSSTDPPPGGPFRRALGPCPGNPGSSRGDQRLAGGGEGGETQASLQGRTGVGRLPSDGAGTLPERNRFSDDEDFLLLLSDIPDFFVPIPRRGAVCPPRPGRRATGQLEPD